MGNRTSDTCPTVRIVERMEDYGLDPCGWCLYECIDPQALDLVVATGDPNIEISFEIRDHRVTLWGDGRLEVMENSET